MSYNLSVVQNSALLMEYLDLMKGQYHHHSSVKSAFKTIPEPYTNSLIHNLNFFERTKESEGDLFLYALLGKSMALACSNRIDEAIQCISGAILRVRANPFLLRQMRAYGLDYQTQKVEFNLQGALEADLRGYLEKQRLLLKTDIKVMKEMILTHQSLVKCYRQTKNYQKALDHAVQAFGIAKVTLGGQKDLVLGPLLKELGELYEIFENKEEAKKYYEQALSIYQKNNKQKSSIFLLKIEQDLAFKIKALTPVPSTPQVGAELPQAEDQVVVEVVDVQRQEDLELADIYNDEMQLAIDKGWTLKARESALKALEIYEALKPPFKGIAAYLVELAELYETFTDALRPNENVAEYKRALFCYKNALGLYEKDSPEDPNVKKIKIRLRDYYGEQLLALE